MDETIVPNQPEQPVIEPKKKIVVPTRTLILVGTIAIVLLLSVLVAWSVFMPKQAVHQAPSPSPSQTAPSTSRQMTPFATSSAFLSVESSVASLSAVTTSYSVEDSTVAPPTLDLPLGFSQ